MDTAVGFTRNGAADRVGHADAKGATFHAEAQGQKGVSRLTRLADKDANVVAKDGRLAIQKVTGQFRRARNLRQLFKRRAGLKS